MSDLKNQKRIGLILPASMAISGPTSGVVRQMNSYKRALELAGFSVAYIDASKSISDFTHALIFQHSPGVVLTIRRIRQKQPKIKIAFLPIFDPHKTSGVFKKILYRVPVELLAHLSSPRAMRLACDLCDEVWVRSIWEEDAIKATGTNTKISKVKLSVSETVIQNSVKGIERDIDYLFVGHFDDPRKNVRNLISALESVGLKLSIVGSGDETFLSNYKSSSRWRSAYEILGRVSDEELNLLYQRAKVVCLPSFYEGVGLAAMEGFANGAKILITSVGGARDYFSENAVYINQPDSVECIKLALKEVGEARKLNCSYRHKFLSRFSEQALAEKFLQSNFFS